MIDLSRRGEWTPGQNLRNGPDNNNDNLFQQSGNNGNEEEANHRQLNGSNKVPGTPPPPVNNGGFSMNDFIRLNLLKGVTYNMLTRMGTNSKS
ncbi:MAG: hypothetical protein WBZ36_26395 [Candidatus Nitrosopolaris sp.]